MKQTPNQVRLDLSKCKLMNSALLFCKQKLSVPTGQERGTVLSACEAKNKKERKKIHLCVPHVSSSGSCNRYSAASTGPAWDPKHKAASTEKPFVTAAKSYTNRLSGFPGKLITHLLRRSRVTVGKGFRLSNFFFLAHLLIAGNCRISFLVKWQKSYGFLQCPLE